MTRNKAFVPMIAIALMLCMGAFLFPVTAFAADADTTPPILTATINSDVLHIEAIDADSGVEAVFIDGKRINYRVDSALDLEFSDYATSGEYVTIFAMDFAGNKSKEVPVKNPNFIQPTAPKEAKPFTPAGTGTVMDNATDGDGKEFFTITTPDDNEFYLIIDRQRNSDNVYLLNAVTEDDLKALAKKGGNKGESAVPNPDPTPTPTPEPTPEPEPEPKPPANNNGTLMFILIAVAAAGGAGYYFKVLKPKQQAAMADEFDEDEDEAGYDEDFDDEEYLAAEPGFDDSGEDKPLPDEKE